MHRQKYSILKWARPTPISVWNIVEQIQGVYDGVTGVFTKPIEGARSEGVEGFFKGLGRGAVGLVARPTAGVVDFASGSLDAVKRFDDHAHRLHVSVFRCFLLTCKL